MHLNTIIKSMRMYFDTYCSLLLIDWGVFLSHLGISRCANKVDIATVGGYFGNFWCIIYTKIILHNLRFDPCEVRLNQNTRKPGKLRTSKKP